MIWQSAIVECKTCKGIAIIHGDQRHFSVADASEKARNLGWSIENVYDTECPECVKDRREGREPRKPLRMLILGLEGVTDAE